MISLRLINRPNTRRLDDHRPRREIDTIGQHGSGKSNLLR